MNKHSFAVLMIIAIFCISVVTYKNMYPNEIQSLSAIETQAGESIDNAGSASSAPISVESNLSVDNGQAVVENKPAAENPAVKSGIPNIEASPTQTASPPAAVSRGSQVTSTSQYPKVSKINGSFGQFRYRELSGGRIEIDPQWIAANIVTITLPGLNQRVQVNKGAADNFIKAFNYIKNGTAVVNGRQVSLLSLVKTMDGTFVTRHVNWNPSRGLSNHSWGTAIDINASSHYVGLRIDPNSTTDPNAILWRKAFQPAGFSWGNRYSTGPDSMHFEVLK